MTGLRLALAVLVTVVGCTSSDAAAEPPRGAPGSAPTGVPAAKGKAATPGGAAARYRKPPEKELRQKLTAEQWSVTQKAGTEAPFRNAYWDNHAPGIYVDVVSGEPLFCSKDKYDSGTGWPSFTRPLVPANVSEHEDESLGVTRTEVRSKHGDSHLGHLFDDGPTPTGQRYCMNSAAMRFVPADELVRQGYAEHAKWFPDVKQKPPLQETVILAGGCFWGMEDILRGIPGVLDTEVGYSGGTMSSPQYEDVKTGDTGHAESVRVRFDPMKLSFEALLGWFFRMHDPTTKNRQGNDIGTQYRSAIFYSSDAQKRTAEQVKANVGRSGKWKGAIVTEITAAGPFFPAEGYHQDYLDKNPEGYTCHFLRE